MSDWGGNYLALYVEDMDAALASLDVHGVGVLDGKKGAVSETGEGSRFAHRVTPWGSAARGDCDNDRTF